jgi:hypothetical protein
MVVRATIWARTDPSETPGVDETVERVVVAVLEEERHHQALKQIRFQDLPGASMWHPCDNILEFLLSKDSIKLYRELLNADRALNAPSVGRRRRGWRRLLFKFVLRYVAEVAVFVHGGSVEVLIVRNQGREASIAVFVIRFSHCLFVWFLAGRVL